MKERKELPAFETLRELFDYNPNNGVLKFKPRGVRYFKHSKGIVHRFGIMKTWNKKFGWRRAGSVYTSYVSGYRNRKVVLFGRPYREHRIIWKWMTGEEPPNVIDHEDGDGCNNRWNNLRKSSDTKNQRNKGRQSNNSSGCTGVTWDKSRNKWKVGVKVDGKFINCGRFSDYDEACEASRKVRESNGFSPNHGKDLKYLRYS